MTKYNPIPPIDNTAREKFWAKVDKSRGGCWEWLGYRSSNGYGKFCFNDKAFQAHRVSMVIAGKSLEGGEVDHLCMNKGCVNPRHLEVVSHRENTNRAIGLKEYCRSGRHRMAGNNLRTRVGTYGKIWKTCRACDKEYKRKWYQRLTTNNKEES